MIITFLHIDPAIYRLCFARYIVFVVLGMELHREPENVSVKKAFLFLPIGMFYMIDVTYLGYTPVIFTNWITTSFPTAFFAFGLLIILKFVFKDGISKEIDYIFSLIGKASYHIYLVQMVYYFSGLGYIFSSYRGIIINVLVCIIIGIVFYKTESLIKSKVRNKKIKL
mgnify:FL=1